MSEPPPLSPLPVARLRANHRELLRLFCRLFGGSLAVLKLIKVLTILLRGRKTGIKKALRDILKSIPHLPPTQLRTSLFVALYPTLYKLLSTLPTLSLHPLPTILLALPSIRTILLSPLLLLLPPAYTAQLNLYTLSALLLASTRFASARGKLDWVPWWLKKGGGWWLFPLTQGWLLDLCVFEPEAFDASYRRVILSRSKKYLPPTSLLPPNTEFLPLLPLFSHLPQPYPRLPPSSLSITLTPSHTSLHRALLLPTQLAPFAGVIASAKQGHTRALCATLHPGEVGCARNFVRQVGDSLPSALGLVGGYSGLVLLLRGSGRKGLKEDPWGTLKKWAKSTLRGGSFITLAISTAWAMTCLLQRLLPPHLLRRSRFGLGGTLAGLWIFLVPSARRLELGLYALRMSVGGGWKRGVGRGWWRYRRGMEIIPFTICLAALLELKKRDPGVMEGWVGKTVIWLDRPIGGSSAAAPPPSNVKEEKSEEVL